jgi:hypothetical protein
VIKRPIYSGDFIGGFTTYDEKIMLADFRPIFGWQKKPGENRPLYRQKTTRISGDLPGENPKLKKF